MPAKHLQRADEGGICYHVYNKGIDQRTIFADKDDYQVFLGYLEDYLSPKKPSESTKKDFTVNGRVFRGVPHQPKNYFKKVELLAYCLKPDHFHLLLNEITRKSLQAFIRSLATRYSMYFNRKYNRNGTLFAGPYKSVQVKDQMGLLHLTRYFHKANGYSSYPEYQGQKETPWVQTKIVLSIKNKTATYQNFVEKYEPNQKEKGLLEKIAIENVQEYLERRDLPETSLNPWSRIPELLAASAVFVLLLGFSLRNIATTAKSPGNIHATLGTMTFSASPAPTPSPEPKIMLTVRYTGVNIREKPTVQSKIIGEANDGDTFEFVSENSGWYEVKLPGNSTGFILKQLIQ